MTFIGTGFILWLTTWIAWEMVKYNYDKRIRPHMNDLIYVVEAHWDIHKIRIGVKVKELKQRDLVEECPNEDLEGWTMIENGRRVPETVITHELIIIDNDS